MKKKTPHEHHHLVRLSNNVGFNKKYTTIAIYTLIVLLFAVVCVYFLLNNDRYTSIFDTLQGIVSPIFFGMLIAYILNPFLNFFENTVFISKAQRTLLKARKELFRAKLSFDQLRTCENTTADAMDKGTARLDRARTALANAYLAVDAEQAQRESAYRKKTAKKKTRPSFFPQAEKNRSHPMRSVSLLCTYIIFFAVIALICWIIIPQCIDSLMRLVGNLQRYMYEIPQRLKGLLDQSTTLRSLYDLISSQVDLEAELYKFLADVTAKLTGLLSLLPNYAISFISSLVSSITNILLSVFFSVYFLSSKEMLGGQVERLGRAFLSPKAYHNTRHVIGEIDRKFGKFIEGKILDSSIIGILALIAMMILQMPYYQMLALIIGITNIIPFFGPMIGGVIGGAIVLISDPAKLIPFILMVLILQQLDGNIIGPQILGDSLGLPPIWIMIAIVVMSGLFNFFGMLFGVPLFAVIYTLVKEAVARRLQKRKASLAAVDLTEDEDDIQPEDPTTTP